MTVLFVRHAHAGDRNDWNGDDALRPLSDLGRRQADAIVAQLDSFAPSKVLSSPALRCVDTVAPLAAGFGLVAEPTDALAEGATRAALDLVRDCADDVVVLCSHGDVIPYVLEALQREEGLEISDRARWQKASTWVLDRSPEGWQARYLPPPVST